MPHGLALSRTVAVGVKSGCLFPCDFARRYCILFMSRGITALQQLEYVDRSILATIANGRLIYEMRDRQRDETADRGDVSSCRLAQGAIVHC